MSRQSDEFKALQKEWYAKLKDDGFADVEQDEESLHVWANHYFRSRYNETTLNAKEEYFRLAGQFLHEYTFETTLEKFIWERHSEGETIRGITQTAKKAGFKTHKNAVHKVVQRLAEVMVKQCKTTQD